MKNKAIDEITLKTVAIEILKRLPAPLLTGLITSQADKDLVRVLLVFLNTVALQELFFMPSYFRTAYFKLTGKKLCETNALLGLIGGTCSTEDCKICC